MGLKPPINPVDELHNSGVVAVIRESPLNVQYPEYGALGDNVTDDTVALKRVETAIVNAGGGSIYVPYGVYRHTTTADQLWDFGANIHVHITGDGSGNVGGDSGSILRRTAGTNETLKVQGSGDTGTTRGHATVHGLEFNGGATSGNVISLFRCNEVLFEDVRIDNATGSLLVGTQLWNCRFSNCFFASGGNGTTSPVVLLNAYSGSSSFRGCNTVQFQNCEWEGCTGTDLKITGDRASSMASFGVTLTNTKFERQVASASWPVLDLDYCYRVNVVGFDISCGGTNNTSRLVTVPVDGPNTVGQGGISFVGGYFGYTEATALSPYCIEQLSGFLSFDGVNFSSVPATTQYFRVGASVNYRGWRVGNIFMPNVTNAVNDERTAGFLNVTSASSIDLDLTGHSPAVATVFITGTTNISTIGVEGWTGRMVVLQFQGILTMRDSIGNLQLAGDFVTTASDTMTLVCTGSTWMEVARSVN